MATAEFALSRRDLFFSRHKGKRLPRIVYETKGTPKPSPKLPEEPGITRRRVLISGAIASAAAAVGLLKPWEWLTPQSNPEIDQYYPELKSQTLYAKGEIRTAQTTTRWFNFTKTDFDPKVAQATFDFFENLANRKETIQYGPINQQIPFVMDKRLRTTREVFIIPEITPLPTGWGDVTFDGSTTGSFNNVYTTFVRVHDSNKTIPPSLMFTTIQLHSSKTFNVEAAQSSIQTSSVSTEIAYLGQEIVCNSYGVAFTVKQMEVPYNRYQTWGKDTQIRRDSSSPYYPLYVLSENEYNEIPKVGLVLR